MMSDSDGGGAAGPHDGEATPRRTLAGLVDAMIPGDDLFPPASAVGAQFAVAARIRSWRGRATWDALVTAATRHGLDHRPSVEVVSALESQEPDLFQILRMTLYLAYYEHPQVTDAVRTLGHDYNDSPQPEGYAMSAYDPEHEAPPARGRYVPTDQVRPVDVSGLAFLRGEERR